MKPFWPVLLTLSTLWTAACAVAAAALTHTYAHSHPTVLLGALYGLVVGWFYLAVALPSWVNRALAQGRNRGRGR